MNLNKFYQDIREASQNDKLVIFVGSGISRISGMPSWYSVIEKFAKNLGIEYFNEYDFLDIPEKYYNKYGLFEYNRILEETLNEDNIVDLDIQKKLFELKPTHIITTNWDRLLEKALDDSENPEYSIVTNDNELSQINKQKVIIKMHGCILNIYKDKNAIVLKYSDYFNYKINFPLIDIYVKSIFATKRVLFLGYSLSDQNVKDILEFIKNRTKHHIYPYFVTFDRYDKVLESKLKQQGVFVIFIEKLFADLLDDNSKYKEAYLRLIEKIKNFDNQTIFDKISLLLSKYNEINFLPPNLLTKYIYNVFGIKAYFGIYGDNCLYLENKDNKIYKYINIFLKKLKIGKISSIELELLKLLSGSNVSCISFGIHNFTQVNLIVYYSKYIKTYDTFNYFDEVLNFNYEGILEYLNKKLQSNINTKDELLLKLQKAFMLYKLSKYNEAIIILKEIKTVSFKTKNYFFNGIAKINLQNLCRLYKFKNYTENDYCKKFNLKEELNNIPSKYLDEELKEIVDFNYFYKEYFEINKLVDKNIKTANFYENGGFSANNYHIELYNRVFHIFLTINYNYLSVEMLNEIKDIYQKSFQALIKNFTIESRQNNKNILYFKPQKLDSLNRMIFYIGVVSSEAKELNIFFKSILKNKKLIFNDIYTIIKTTLPNVMKIDNFYFQNSIIILSYTQLQMYQIFKILKLFIMNISQRHDFTIYDTINYFLVNQYHNLNSKVLLKQLESLFIKFIDKFICNQFSIADRESINSVFFNSIVNIFLNYNYKINIEKEKVNIFLKHVDNNYKNNYKNLFRKLEVNL